MFCTRAARSQGLCFCILFPQRLSGTRQAERLHPVGPDGLTGTILAVDARIGQGPWRK
jgi:hypothetical protein